MHAVVRTGGRNYRVKVGQVFKVEKLESAETGTTISLDQVLLTSDGENVVVGAPLVSGAEVLVEVVRHAKGKKTKIIKFKRRKHSMKKQGHRQWFTELKVTEIKAS